MLFIGQDVVGNGSPPRDTIPHCGGKSTEQAIRAMARWLDHCTHSKLITVGAITLPATRDSCVVRKTNEQTVRRPCRVPLHAPDRQAAEADTGIMGVTCQAIRAATGRLVFELEARAGERPQRTHLTLSIAQHLASRWTQPGNDGNRAVSRVALAACPCVNLWYSVPNVMRQMAGNVLKFQGIVMGLGLTTHPLDVVF